MAVELLTEHGISATDVKKLKESGFYTVQSLSMRPKKVRCARSQQRYARARGGGPLAARGRPLLSAAAPPVRAPRRCGPACARHAAVSCSYSARRAALHSEAQPRRVQPS